MGQDDLNIESDEDECKGADLFQYKRDKGDAAAYNVLGTLDVPGDNAWTHYQSVDVYTTDDEKYKELIDNIKKFWVLGGQIDNTDHYKTNALVWYARDYFEGYKIGYQPVKNGS